ncbi:MAG: hypothetical protein IPK59_19545 [Rhodospirillaceae bacterium]|nr:hypothetical protein [Rhodospirillaceae bacterium]
MNRVMLRGPLLGRHRISACDAAFHWDGLCRPGKKMVGPEGVQPFKQTKAVGSQPALAPFTENKSVFLESANHFGRPPDPQIENPVPLAGGNRVEDA